MGGDLAKLRLQLVPGEPAKRRRTVPLLAAYTWSKAIDDKSGFNDIWTNPYNPQALRSLSAFDMPQNLVVSYAYDLPFGKLADSNRACWMDGRFPGLLVSLPALPVTIAGQL